MFKKIGSWITAAWSWLDGKKRWITIAYGSIAGSAYVYFQVNPRSKEGIILWAIGAALTLVCGGHGIFKIATAAPDDTQDDDDNVQKSTT